ncbi:hypothetical protein [Methylobacterium sp. 174MFSha1.1]|uniref:hypothetical protein n=1 Tax=Methylobacterium sp. 174MFSha1.1 TaxID=1502749 RepID=UPI0011603352|nr:hypothetical protein [Methylobacterium sp. 174MFSha1.1]
MIIFLLLACGFPGLIFLYIRQRVPDTAWSRHAVASRMHTAPPKPFQRYPGYLGGLRAEGSDSQKSDKILSAHGAGIEHGFTSNTTRSDDKEQRSEDTNHIGGALVREQGKTPPATDSTGIGPPPAGSKISPDGKVTSVDSQE